MNFILTLKCNKFCPYCFAAEVRKKEGFVDMDFELFKKFISKIKNKNRVIKLLGGEPTLHPQFKEIVNYVLAEHRPLTIITNLLFDESTLSFLVDKYEKGYNINYLINGTDLDTNKKRADTWFRNYNLLYKTAYKKALESNLSVGYTLMPDKNADFYIKYSNFLLNNIPAIETLRISLMFPGSEKAKENLYFINNKDLGDDIIKIVKFAIDNMIKPRLDCIIYPCMFRSREHFKIMTKFVESVRTICSNGAPADVFPDGTMSYCYPLRESIKVDTDKYEDLEQAAEDIQLRYKAILSTIKLPDACQNCNFIKMGLCQGPCLANFKLNKPKIGLNL